MKVISFSLFGSKDYPEDRKWEWFAYLRGLVWQVKMIKLLLPDFICHCEIDSKTFSDYDNIFYGLNKYYGMAFVINEEVPLCRAMLWRLKPVFNNNIDYMFCRDADALMSYREGVAMKQFIESGLTIHGISDNPAHSIPLMGGMCGFKCAPIRDMYRSWNNLLSLSKGEINLRGTDQVFLNNIIYEDFKEGLLSHYGEYSFDKGWVKNTSALIENDKPNSLWASSLCSFFIGAAGVNELETIRYLRANAEQHEGFEDILKRYPKVFYWYA